MVAHSAAAATAVEDARALVQAGKPGDAIARLEVALRAGGADKSGIALELVRTQIAAGRLISAQQTAENFLRDAPVDPQRNALALLNARLREAAGSPADAFSLYRVLAEQTPAISERADALAAAVRIAGQLNNAGMVERSLAEFTESFPQDPRTSGFLLRLYRVRVGQGDQRGAADAVHRFKAAFPNDPAGAALSEAYHLAQAGDAKAAVSAFQAERKLPTFTLTAPIVATVLDAMRRDPAGYALIEPLATEFATLTGDPQFQVLAVEWLPALNLADQAATLGNVLLPALSGSAWAPRLRLALANAQWLATKKAAGVEKLLVTVLTENPASDTAWNLYREVTAGANRADAYPTLLAQTLAVLPSQKNLSLRFAAQGQIRYRLAQLAWDQHDASATAKHAKAFLEADGLSVYGPEVIKLFSDVCFDGMRDAPAAGFDAKFAILLPALETYLVRTIAWGPALDAIDTQLKPRLAPKSFASQARQLNEMLARVSQNTLVKSSLSQFQRFNAAADWPKAAAAGEILLPKLLAVGNTLGFEGGTDIIDAIFRARQWDRVVAATRLYLAKYPGATGPLNTLAIAARQLGSPDNREVPALIANAIAQAGGSSWPHDSLAMNGSLFAIAEQNRLPSEMVAQFKLLATAYPGFCDAWDYQRRIGETQAAAGDLEQAKQTLLAAAKAAQSTGMDPRVLHVIALLFPDSAGWPEPLLDAYLARPTRGPQQGGIQLLRARLLVTAKKDPAAALQAVKAAAARPVDLLWNAGSVPSQWVDAFVQPIASAPVSSVTSEQVAQLSDFVTVFGPQLSWTATLMLRQAQTGRNLEFSESLNILTALQSSRDGIALATVYLPLAQQLVTLEKPELAGLVLRAAVNRFTDVDAKLRSQASQSLFSLSSKSGFRAVEIDEKLEWAPLLRAATSFRNGDPVVAWQLFQANDALFDKYEDKLPVDFLRWVSERLLQRDDDPSRERAEKILRRWIIANENSTAMPAAEKAATQLQLADVYFKTLRYDLARSECLSLANRFPDTPQATEAQFRIGECYLNQKMYVDASKVFDGLAKSKNKQEASRGEFFLGVLAQQRGDTEDAKARFRNVMDLAPSNEVADAILYRLSELYGQENRFSDELTLLRSIGLIGSSAKQWHTPGQPLNIVIQDSDLGVSRGQSYVPVVVTTSSGDREVVHLESGSAGKGFFRAELPTQLGAPKPGDHILQVNGTDVITYDYPDDFKKQFTNIAPPRSNIRLASDAEFRMSATEIKDEEEITFEERLREQRRIAGKQPGFEFRQEFRKGDDLKPGNNIYLQVKDADRCISSGLDTVKLLVTAASGDRVTATLTETAPFSGVFRGTVKTVEIPANIFASDYSSGNEAVRAIDNNRKTSWEGLNDGRAPKFILLDLKQPVKLGGLKWGNDGFRKDKVPLEYGVQVSNDQMNWTTVAATADFTRSTKSLAGRITTTAEGNLINATVDLTGAEGRYVRMLIEKFSGSAPRIAEIQLSDASGAVLIPAPARADAEAVSAEGLRLTPSDRITAVYDDETNISSPGHTRSLTQQIQATYYNGRIDFIAYEFKAVEGQNEPIQFVKQVRRVEPGQRVIVRIVDYDCDVSDKCDKVKFSLRTPDGKETVMEVIETGPFTGVFTKEIDIWSAGHPKGVKLEAGTTLEASYLDEQNTDPGAPIRRMAYLDLAVPSEAKVAFVPSTVKVNKDGKASFQFTPAPAAAAPAIKPVAFEPPLTFEIIDPASAKDSFSEVTAVLTTTGGSRVEVICPLSTFPDGRARDGRKPDEALERGRFVGQIFMTLGDKDSPATSVLELGDTRTLVPRRNPVAWQDQKLANIVPVLNLNGQDIITVSYSAAGKTVTDQARLAVKPTIEFTDGSYEKPVTSLYLGDKVYVSVKDLTADATSGPDSVEVLLTTPRGEKFVATLLETLNHSGEFTGSFPLVPNANPVPGDQKMEAWFGDVVTLSYISKANANAKFERTINVARGTDANLMVFEKKYATEQVAIESQFRMAEAYFELFKNYRTLKQETQAGTVLTEGMQILKELREDYPSKIYEARTDYLLGQFAQELKKYDEAIGYYRRIVQNYSDHPLAPDAQYKLGQCQEEKGDMDAASAEYVTLAYTWPENPLVANVVVRIAEYFYNKKEYPTAAEVAKKFVERFPQHEWAERMLFRAAQCWYKADQFEQAGKEFDLLVENYPRGKFRSDAIFWAGESYRSAHQLETAFRRYKRVTWDYPESDAAKFARGKLVLPEMVNVADKDLQPQ